MCVKVGWRDDEQILVLDRLVIALERVGGLLIGTHTEVSEAQAGRILAAIAEQREPLAS